MSPGRPDPAQGVFETLLVDDGHAAALDAHLARLGRSVRSLYGAPLPPDTAARVTERTVAAPGPRRVRVDAIPGHDGIQVAITVSAVPARTPVTLRPVVVPGGLGAHKWRDRRLVEALDPATPLLLDTDGTVLEAAWANLWILDRDTLITPPLDGRILPGVTRASLLALAPGLGLTAREEPITLDQARTAPTLFVTSSLRLAVPAVLAGQALPEQPDDVDRIAAALRET